MSRSASNDDDARFHTFRASARRMKPTKAHRAGLWENMLGTIYARNADGEVRYFDYAYADALTFIGPHSDVRVSRLKDDYYDLELKGDSCTYPRRGKLVWFVRYERT
jgi:hypothetical protein